MTIYLAGGCFWGVENFLRQIKGVTSTEVGYINGNTENPSYDDVCNASGHAECVRVIFDEEKISLKALLDLFYQVIDPISINKQGNDRGVQYRTGIYYEDNILREVIIESLANLQKDFMNPIAVEYMPLKNYYRAEEYHQKYLIKNPNGYCHINESRIRQILDK